MAPEGMRLAVILPASPLFPRFVSGVLLQRITNFENGVLDIETINPTCIVWLAGAMDSAFAIQ